MFILIYLTVFFLIIFIIWAWLHLPEPILIFIAFLWFFFILSLFLSFFYFIIELLLYWKKFVPFVPSSTKTTNDMIKLANLEDKKKVYDLWCWDWKVIFKAAKKYNCKFIWIEKKPDLYLIAKIWSMFYPNVEIYKKDFFKENISDADVIFLYLLTETMNQLESKIQKECKKGTVIISHTFSFPNMEVSEKIDYKCDKVLKYII